MHEKNHDLDWRDFMKRGGQVTAAVALLGINAVRGAGSKNKKSL